MEEKFPFGNFCGGRWIRTIEGVKPADLQSAPFGHSGIPPKIYKVNFPSIFYSLFSIFYFPMRILENSMRKWRKNFALQNF